MLLMSVTTLQAEQGVTLESGGRIKLDLIHNDTAVSGTHLAKADLAFTPGSIPVVDNHNSSEVNFRESRLWGMLRLPLWQRELAAYTEIDFFDIRQDNFGPSRVSNSPRLRHAYMSYGPLTLGMTYTTFVNQSAYPEINDANGPVGTLSIRQDIIRYQHDFPWGHIQFAIEEPLTKLTDNAGWKYHRNDETVPDLVSKLTWEGTGGNLTFAFMARKIGTDVAWTYGNANAHWGGAVSVAGSWYTVDRDNLRFTLSWGNALGRYVSFGTFNDGVIDARGRIELTELLSGFVSYQHWWSRTLRSNAVIGFAYLDTATGIMPATASETMASSQLNLIWSPMLNLSVGIEWLTGYRQQVDGRSGNLNRIQLSSIYKF
jgi:hypothetical protein